MKNKISKILLVFLLIIGTFIMFNNKNIKNHNIFEYIFNNLNWLYIKDQKVIDNNQADNDLQVYDYIDQYQLDDSINTIQFIVEKNFFAEEKELIKRYEIKHEMEYQKQKIIANISLLINFDGKIIPHINKYVTTSHSTSFTSMISFPNQTLSTDEKMNLYNLWFNNFSQLILDKAYATSYYANNNWGNFSPYQVYLKRFSLNAEIFNEKNCEEIKKEYNQNKPIINMIDGKDGYIEDTFNPNNNYKLEKKYPYF